LKNIILTSLLLSIIVFYSCKEKVTNPPDTQLPEGYQQDIPWASLADSPWPMYHGDAQQTGRSKFIGPTIGKVEKIIPDTNMQAGIVIGFDNTIYFTTYNSLVASDYYGNIKWKILLGAELNTTPLIGHDTTIYVANGSLKTIYAINKDGSIKWEYKLNYSIWNPSFGIDLYGNLYFVNASTLSVVSKEGKLIWQLYDERLLSGYDDVVSFSPDGKTVYCQGRTVSLIAIDIATKKILWTFGKSRLQSGAVVDNKGNIYIFPDSDPAKVNYFYSLTPTGEIRWKFQHEENDFMLDNVEPAIDKDGNIFFGFSKLYSLDYSGKLRWKLDFGGYKIFSAILTDRLGNIFLGTSLTLGQQKIISISNSGEINWDVNVNERAVGSSAALSEDGTLFYPTFRSNNLYIIK